MTQNDALIDIRLALTGLSLDFVRQGNAMGFSTIRDIVATEPAALIAMEGFSYPWLAELVQHLRLCGRLELLQRLGPANEERQEQ